MCRRNDANINLFLQNFNEKERLHKEPGGRSAGNFHFLPKKLGKTMPQDQKKMCLTHTREAKNKSYVTQLKVNLSLCHLIMELGGT